MNRSMIQSVERHVMMSLAPLLQETPMPHTPYVYVASADVIDFALETDFGDDASDSEWVVGV